MDIDAALAYVSEHHHAVIAVLKKDGTPALSPVSASVLDGKVVISTRETAFKVKSLRRDARAWLCVFPDGFGGKWVQLAADVEIVDMPEALDGLTSYYRSIAGEHPDWAEYAAAMAREQRVLLQLTLTAAGPTKQG
jgi:PPOX class probable F420-dependent enzyme